MTERERIERTYKKVKKKHPDVTDKIELRRLAIRREAVRDILWRGLFLGAFFAVANLIITGKWQIAVASFLLFVAASVPVSIITSKRLFLPSGVVVHKGTLTKELILRDIERYYKKRPFYYSRFEPKEGFRMVKIPLWDKENTGDTDSDSLWFYFKFDGYKLPVDFFLSNLHYEKLYKNSVIGEEYYVVMSVDEPDRRVKKEGMLKKNQKIIADEYHPLIMTVYKAAEYDLSDELTEYFDRELENRAERPMQ